MTQPNVDSNAHAAATSWFYESSGGRSGPVTAEVLRDLLRRGTVSNDTLVWNPTFNELWKPLSQTELYAPRPDIPPPLPAAKINDTFAWVLALIPVIGFFVERMLEDVVQLSTPQIFFIYFIPNTVIALVDANKIEKSGRKEKDIKVGFWFWLVPVYLFQRARALGQQPTYFWAWLIAFGASVFISNPEILSSTTYWGFGLPGCASPTATDTVKSLLNEAGKGAGQLVLVFQDITELSTSDVQRECRGMASVSDGVRYGVHYTISEADDQYVIQITKIY